MYLHELQESKKDGGNGNRNKKNCKEGKKGRAPLLRFRWSSDDDHPSSSCARIL